MKKVILLVALAFATNIMAEVEKSAIKSYIGVGLRSVVIISLVDGTSSTSDSGDGLFLNGGVILDDNARINVFYHSTYVDSGFSLLGVTQLGVSYDYLFGNQKQRKGFFVGSGIVNTTTKTDTNFLGIQSDGSVGNVNVKSSASSIGLLLRGGYEYTFDNGLLLIAAYNVDLGTQKGTLKYDNNKADRSVETSISGLGLSINYTF
jgi:hypothetical protein